MSPTMLLGNPGHCLASTPIESTIIHIATNYVTKKIVYMHMFMIAIALQLALSIYITSSSCRSNLNGKIDIIRVHCIFYLQPYSSKSV